MLHSMTIRLIHVHHLATLYLCYGVKCQSGVNWGHWGQKVIFTKNTTSPADYKVWSHDSCTCVSLTPATKVITLKIHPGSFGVTGVKRSFSLKCCNSSMLHSMTIRLIHVHHLATLYPCYGVKCQSGVNWGHWGQKVIFTKNTTSLADYKVWSHDSCTCISLTPATKNITLKIHPGSFGVTGVKRSFSLKML